MDDPPAACALSPCTGVCRIESAEAAGEGGWCAGCRRSLAEIARWSAMPRAEKLAVLAALPLRGKAAG